MLFASCLAIPACPTAPSTALAVWRGRHSLVGCRDLCEGSDRLLRLFSQLTLFRCTVGHPGTLRHTGIRRCSPRAVPMVPSRSPPRPPSPPPPLTPSPAPPLLLPLPTLPVHLPRHPPPPLPLTAPPTSHPAPPHSRTVVSSRAGPRLRKAPSRPPGRRYLHRPLCDIAAPALQLC